MVEERTFKSMIVEVALVMAFLLSLLNFLVNFLLMDIVYPDVISTYSISYVLRSILSPSIFYLILTRTFWRSSV